MVFTKSKLLLMDYKAKIHILLIIHKDFMEILAHERILHTFVCIDIY